MIASYKKYIAKATLCIMALTSIAASTTLADDYLYVKASHLNVRTAPSVKGKIMATVDSWYRVKILEVATWNWRKVLLENWEVGYMNSKYLTDAEPYYEKVTSSRYTIRSGKAFLRGFDLTSKVAVLEKWDVLEITSEKVYLSKWIQVRVVSSKIKRYEWRVWYIVKKLTEPLEGYAYTPSVPEQFEIPAATPTSDTSSISTDSSSVVITPTDEIMLELNSAPESSDNSEISVDTWSDDLSSGLEDTTSSDAGWSDSSDADIDSLLQSLWM